MKRLTGKCDGKMSISLKANGCEKDAWSLSDKHLFGIVADRLAAYENTGLEPEDIQEAVDLFADYKDADIPTEIKEWVKRCTWHVKKCNELRKRLSEYEAIGSPDRLRTLMQADQEGRLLEAELPIGTTVYQLGYCETEGKKIIDGIEYTRKVPNWYVMESKYSWIDAVCDSEHPERKENPWLKYYLSKDEVIAERDRLNAEARHIAENF